MSLIHYDEIKCAQAMKRSKIQNSNIHPDFIGAWSAVPISICDELIGFFDKRLGKQTQGVTSVGLNRIAKSRTDISIRPRDIPLEGYRVFQDYFKILHHCYKEYVDQWPILQEVAYTLDVGTFNIGKYSQGQHFNKLHCERSPLSQERILAFMTYLNDVESGGSTYFSHYDIEIKPQKGLTLLWPADWTHAHKGNPMKEGEKYIITGWLDVA